MAEMVLFLPRREVVSIIGCSYVENGGPGDFALSESYFA